MKEEDFEREMKQEIMILLGEETVKRAKELCPVDTGKLRDSIKYKIEKNTVIVIADTDYAEYVEFGTPPHIIEPVTKEALHFFVDGEEVFTKLVHHPGIKVGTVEVPRKTRTGQSMPFLRPAIHQVVTTINERVTKL